MKSRIITSVIALVLLSFTNAFSADGDGTSGTFYGDVGGTGWVAGVSGNRAKFSEYRDMRSQGGFYSDIRLGYDSDNYWAKFKATDMGYDTQNYQAEGGMYGRFKANFFFNDIIHNFTFNAKSPYANIGGTNLVSGTGAWTSAATMPTNTAIWNTFDYSVKREQLGGGVKIDVLKPFYVDFSAYTEHKTGIYPNGDNYVDIPTPIDWTTNTYIGEIGYAAKPVVASLSYLYTDFNNADPSMLFLDPHGATATTGPLGSDVLSLPPDNNYYRIGFKGSVQLPMNTRFMTNISTGHEKSSYNLITGNWFFQGGSQGTESYNSPTFHGRKDINNLNFVLTTNPISFLDGRLYYKYYSAKNKSDIITDTNTSTSGAVTATTSEPFDYRNSTYGTELGFKLPAKFYLHALYNYVITDRSREDIPVTRDNIYSAELRWNGLDFLTPKVGYEHLARTAKGPSASDLAANPQDQWARRFDATAQTRDTYKAGVDIYPLESLDLGVAYKNIKSHYPDAVYLLQDSKTDEFDFYGGYRIGSIARVHGYFDLEYIKATQASHFFNATSGGVFDPNSAASGTSFNWSQTTNDNTYEWGIGTDVYVIPKKLTFTLQFDYVNSNGTDDFNLPAVALVPNNAGGSNSVSATGAAANGSNVNINNFDDYKKSALTAKLAYNVSKSLIMSVGASFEHYAYNDVGYDNYLYAYIPVNSNGTAGNASQNGVYQSGAYASPNYNASMYFLTAMYKF